MASTHPLELTEVVSNVACFVSFRSLPACARVSKTWYQAFIPIIWRDIRLNRGRAHPPKAIQSHAHLVRTLDIDCPLIQEHVDLRLPSLNHLDMDSQNEASTLELVFEHPTLIHLKLWGLVSEPPRLFWENLLVFQNLRDLTLSYVNISEEEDIDKFWELCMQLERLDIRRQQITMRGTLLSRQFSHIRDLTMGCFHGCDVPLTMEFIQRCPNLTSYEWMADPSVDTLFIPEFTRLLTTATWRNLDSVFLRSPWIAGDDISKVVGSMRRIAALGMSGAMSVGPDFMASLRPFFFTIQKLVLAAKDITSTMAQEVMSSCPTMETFTALSINDIDIVEGQPWVCLRLRVLHVMFHFNPSAISYRQPLVFEQLSRLTRLEELDIGGGRLLDRPGGFVFQELSDLRLENGLDKLSTLRLLRVLDFKKARQKMEEQEIEWMIEHWKSLDEIHGGLNLWDHHLEMLLVGRLREHGIASHRIAWHQWDKVE